MYCTCESQDRVEKAAQRRTIFHQDGSQQKVAEAAADDVDGAKKDERGAMMWNGEWGEERKAEGVEAVNAIGDAENSEYGIDESETQ